MSATAVILLVGVIAAIGAYLVSMSRAVEFDPIDPIKEERWLVRVLASHPTLAYFVKRRLDPSAATGLLLTMAVGIVFGLAVIAGWIFDSLDRQSGFARFDESVAEWGAANATDLSTTFLNVLTDFGGTTVVIAVTVLMGIYGWWRHRNLNVALFMISVTAGQALINNGLKLMVDRERPDIDQLASFAGSSFPSGHSAAAAATWAAVALVLSINAGRFTRAALAAGAALIAMGVAATRALLGVHWLTDVIAGVSVGWAWFIICAVAFGGREMRLGAPFRRVPSRARHTSPELSRRKRFRSAPLNRQDFAWLGAAYLFFTAIGTVVGIFVSRALSSSSFAESDLQISEWFQQRRTEMLNALTDAGSAFSDTMTIVIALSAAAVLLVVILRRWHDAAFLTAAVVLETASFVSIAWLVGRDRPPVEQLDISPPTASFPSGHTAAAVAFYVALALLMKWHAEKTWTKTIAISAAVVVPMVVAVSRVYRGMHFTTDVLAGAVLGLASVYVAFRIYRRSIRRLELSPADDTNLVSDSGDPVAPLNGFGNGHRPGRIAVVANPVGAAEQATRLRAMLTGDPSVLWLETSEEDPGVGQTRSAVDDGAEIVIACGGDGTVRACVEGLESSDTALAVVPAGTGNLLARNLAIPEEPEKVLDAVAGGQRSRLDVGKANGESFAVMAGIGLDARIMRDTDRTAKDRFGVLAYVREALRHLLDRPVRCKLEVDGDQVFTGEAATVLIGNLGEIQGGLDLFPNGSPADGQLDVLVVSASSFAQWVKTAWAIATNGPTTAPIHRFAGRNIKVDLERPTPYEIDGEPRPAVTTVSFEVARGALEVCVPKEAS